MSSLINFILASKLVWDCGFSRLLSLPRRRRPQKHRTTSYKPFTRVSVWKHQAKPNGRICFHHSSVHSTSFRFKQYSTPSLRRTRPDLSFIHGSNDQHYTTMDQRRLCRGMLQRLYRPRQFQRTSREMVRSNPITDRRIWSTRRTTVYRRAQAVD